MGCGQSSEEKPAPVAAEKAAEPAEEKPAEEKPAEPAVEEPATAPLADLPDDEVFCPATLGGKCIFVDGSCKHCKAVDPKGAPAKPAEEAAKPVEEAEKPAEEAAAPAEEAAAPAEEATAPAVEVTPAGSPNPAGELSPEYRKFEAVFKDLGIRANKDQRKAEWKKGNPDGNEMTSEQWDAWVLLQLKEKEEADADALYAKFKTVIAIAFNDARDIAPDTGLSLRWPEFRVCICYLTVYGKILDAFSGMDGGVQVNLEEFKKGIPSLKASESIAFTDETLDGKEEVVFDEIQAGPTVDFKEICKYVEKKEKENNTVIGAYLSIGDDEDKDEP